VGDTPRETADARELDLAGRADAPLRGDAAGIGRRVRALVEPRRLAVAVDGHVDHREPVRLETRNPERQTRLIPGLTCTTAAGGPHQHDAGVHCWLVYRLGGGEVGIGLCVSGPKRTVDDLDVLGDEVAEVGAADRTACQIASRANLFEIQACGRRNTARESLVAIGGQGAGRRAAQYVRDHRAVTGGVVGRLRANGQIALEPRNPRTHGRGGGIDTRIQDANIDAPPGEALALCRQRARRNQVVVRRIVRRRRWWRRRWWWWWWRRRRRRWRWRRAGLDHAIPAATSPAGSEINGSRRDNRRGNGQHEHALATAVHLCRIPLVLFQRSNSHTRRKHIAVLRSDGCKPAGSRRRSQ